MAGMIEVAKATVTIVPNMEGSQKTITSELTGAAGNAGEQAGKAAGQKMSGAIGTSLKSAGSAMTAGFTVPIAAAAAGAVSSWKEVDAAMDTVAAKTGATGENLKGLTDSMKNVATSIPVTFQAAGDAIGEVSTKFGLTGTELETLSTQFLEFAKITGADVSGSVDMVANTLAAFGEDSANASSVLDALTQVSQTTGISIEELGSALQNNAATFSEMGMSVEQAATLMGAFNTAGLTAAQAQTALRTAMKNAVADGQTLNQALQEFSVTMQSNASDTEKLQAAYDLFGSKAGASIYQAFSTGKVSIEDFTGSMVDASGTVSKTFDEMVSPMDRFQQATNGLKTLGADLLTALGPSIDKIAETAIPVIEKLVTAFSNLPTGVQQGVVAFALVTAAVGPVLTMLSKLGGAVSVVTGTIGKIAGSAASAASGIGKIGSSAASAAGGAASAASGFGAMAGSALQIVALGAGLALAGVGLKQIADGAVAIGQGGLPAAAALLELVAALAGLMAIVAALGPALTAGAAGMLAFGTAMLEIGVAITAVEAGFALLTEAFASLVFAIGQNSEELSKVLGTVGASIGLVVEQVGKAISGVLDAFAGIIRSIGDAAQKSGYGMEAFANGIKTIVQLNLLDLVASLGAVSKGIADIAQSANGIAGITSEMMTLGSVLQVFAIQTQGVVIFIMEMMSYAVQGVTEALAQMVAAFASTHFVLNADMALPHFKMSGKFDAKTRSVPEVSVEWYAKAAEQGALFSSPQLIGVGDARQPEMLIGESTLYDKISQAVGENSGGDVYVYIGEHQLDAIIKRSQKRMTVKSGVK